ncbi:MAG: Tim44 domain-containing protein [Syntrophobacteraceae bacterium]|nr:Tim44 domain-containing protein [Syntrophobacteraceae bacterium]
MKRKNLCIALALSAVLFFGLSVVLESYAWARAGGGRSMGSRGSRTFSTPSTPTRPTTPAPTPSSPGMSTPGRQQTPGSQPATGGTFGRSPFLQGLAGGLAGGFLGSMLFGGMGHAGGAAGQSGGGGIGFLEILIIGAGIYFLMKFLRRRREQTAEAGYSSHAGRMEIPSSTPSGTPAYLGGSSAEPVRPYDEVEKGFQDIKRFDPGFDEESFKETVQDIFFRIQAGWMNRSLDGIGRWLTSEMAENFTAEFDRLKREGRSNRLENIAVRKVEPSEVWQESGKEYVTVLFTANLLDYTVDDRTGEVVSGSKLDPVKFQEFWTFCRDIGASQWQLCAINQVDEQAPGIH